MIEAIRSYSHHTLFGVVGSEIPELLSSINALVNRIALSIIVQIVISILHFSI